MLRVRRSQCKIILVSSVTDIDRTVEHLPLLGAHDDVYVMSSARSPELTYEFS
jgi:hypothetical protein